MEAKVATSTSTATANGTPSLSFCSTSKAWTNAGPEQRRGSERTARQGATRFGLMALKPSGAEGRRPTYRLYPDAVDTGNLQRKACDTTSIYICFKTTQKNTIWFYPKLLVPSQKSQKLVESGRI